MHLSRLTCPPVPRISLLTRVAMVFDLDRGTNSILRWWSNDWAGHRRSSTSGLGGGAVTFLPEKNYAMLEKVGVEIGMQTQTFTIFLSMKLLSLEKKSSIENLHT